MVILTASGSVLENPDYNKGRTVTESIPVVHRYVVDQGEEGHWETIAEYPETGGADVEWKVDRPEKGHWETVGSDGRQVEHCDIVIPADWPREAEVSGIWTFGRYVEYTASELASLKKSKEEASSQAATAAAIPGRVDACEDQVTNLQLALVELYERTAKNG